MKITASAPGKVAILGEYAVLEGAPALVMAVDRRARVTLETHGESFCSVAAPGWTHVGGRFQLDGSGAVWSDDGARSFPLAAHILDAFFGPGGRDSLTAHTPFHLVLDSASLMETGAGTPTKLGLGSSAALTVALCSVLGYYAASQQGGVHDLDLSRLMQIHAGYQGHRGSGLDIAASMNGGLIEYRRSPSPRARSALLPAGVRFCFVWSGCQAATGGFLARIDEWRASDAPGYQSAMASLAEVAEAGARAARENDSEEFLRLLDDYAGALQGLGHASGTDILSEPHRRLRALARRCGVRYKPCGAGGGDIGVGMALDPQALSGFRDGVIAEGFQPLSLGIDHQGVRTQPVN